MERRDIQKRIFKQCDEHLTEGAELQRQADKMRNLFKVTHELSLPLTAFLAQDSQSSDQHTCRFPAPAVSQELVGPTALQSTYHVQNTLATQKAVAEQVTRPRTAVSRRAGREY